MNSLTITITGNLVNDPELRFTPNGNAVAKFTVAHNTRTKKGEQWVDGEASYFDCTVWRQLAENVAESLRRGTQVILVGRMRTERWEDKDGGKRSKLVIDAEHVGPDLTWAVASVKKLNRNGNSGPVDEQWEAAEPAPAKPATAPAKKATARATKAAA